MTCLPEPDLPLRVLIVDDDLRVLKALTETITREADLLVVGQGADAPTALQLALSTRPTVVLMDVLLPDADTGLALLTALNRLDCSVVAMSIRSNLRRAALDAGAVAFVDKGADIDAMLRSVRAAGHRPG
jgi:DNA-binding NarL/FixJ family response regulator